MKRKFIFLIVILYYPLFSQTTPQQGLVENKPDVFAYTNATIIPEAGKVIQNASIVFKDGQIIDLGNNINIPEDAVVKNLQGRFIYPGFVEPYARFGIPEPKKERDKPGPNPEIERKGMIYWNAAVKPQYITAEDFKADKEAEEWRNLGFTSIQTSGMDGIFQGFSATVLTNEGLSNKLILNKKNAQFMSFNKGSSKQDYPGSLMGVIALIRQTFYDADWYGKAQSAYSQNPTQKMPEKNSSLDALQSVINKNAPIIIGLSNYLDVLRASKIAQEFKLNFIYKTGGDEYKRLADIKKLNSTLIVPLDFPEKPDVTSADDYSDVSLEDLKAWDTAPENPALLEKAGIRFAFTTDGLKDKKSFLKSVRKAVKRGLSPEVALAALTNVPAEISGVANKTGTLAKNKLANFIILDKDIFEDDAQIQSVVIKGEEHKIEHLPVLDPRGKWSLDILELNGLSIDIKGSKEKPQGTVQKDTLKIATSDFSVDDTKISFNILADTLGVRGIIQFSGRLSEKSASGLGIRPDGTRFNWKASKTEPFEEKDKKDESSEDAEKDKSLFTTVFPDMAYGRAALPDQPAFIAITNATIWTSTDQGILEEADLLIQAGKISAIGKDLVIPSNTLVIDGSGLHVTAGIIDEHSHIAISRGVNEGTQAVTAEVRIGDVVNPDNIHIYRQLAGGVTVSQLLHGSANPIGGQAQVIKLRWGQNAEGLKFKEAPPTIKFALGENVKQSNWGDNYRSRYPQTRMGVREIIWDTFHRAREYEQEWKVYNALSSSTKKKTIPPRKDIELDAIVEILNSERFIHCHSYVQSEILMLMRLAEEYGFRIQTFTHILEGYKVAKEMAEHGAGGSSFADWWAYKFEVYEAIPYNMVLMADQGVVTSVNSDDAEMARRLNHEAAKAIKYGAMSEEEAWKMVTINPAKQLKVDQFVGSLEKGKQADFVIWNGNPLSVYSKVLQTWIDGRKYFDVEEDRQLRETIRIQRAALIQKALKEGSNSTSKTKKPKQKKVNEFHCDDRTDYGREY